MIPASLICRVAPRAMPYAMLLVEGMQRERIDDNNVRAATFLGQIHVESNGFKSVVESLNYSADRLVAKFGRHRISRAQARQLGRTSDHPADQEALANVLYGGEFGRRQLGNIEAGDGWRFRGRGLKMITGRDNYRAFSRWWLGDDKLLLFPERVAEPLGAVASAVWFWSSRPRLNAYADHGDVTAVTEIVNGGHNGLDERREWTRVYLQALQDRA